VPAEVPEHGRALAWVRPALVLGQAPARARQALARDRAQAPVRARPVLVCGRVLEPRALGHDRASEREHLVWGRDPASAPVRQV
jgi:hypothetical protein